ncbi:MAG: N-acetylmuramoyl-L-alanine amidase [Roseburia sp.]|nr:N-acetylmuramoyl-L-alanine amidase [Roseburia sp.]
MAVSKPDINRLITKVNFSDSNRSKGQIKYLVKHYVGATGGAEANCRYFYDTYRGASAHFFVGHNGEIWQCVEENDTAWHCGAKSYKHKECRNSNSIGVELCVKKDANGKWYYTDETKKAAVILFAYLMEKYDIDIDHVLRHFDVTGKTCGEPDVRSGNHVWAQFKKDISASIGSKADSSLTQIEGEAQATASQMEHYILSKNSSVPKSVRDMIPYYLSEGKAEGIRGDIAFAQSCLETGNFTFKDSAVTLNQNNFCGMGVTSNGMKGNSFDTPQIGIRAQIQHLKAYACSSSLNQACVDQRFGYVERGCAPYVEHLGIQENPKKKGWAAGEGYGRKILAIIDAIKKADAGDVQSDNNKKETNEFQPYTIVTTCDALRIRAGAGTNYGITGCIRETAGEKKKYTIMEEKNGWGRLKSGIGWISLAYTKKTA